MSEGAERITKERQRHISGEGWTAAHDDEHDGAELLRAAVCYALEPLLQAGDHPVGFNAVAVQEKLWPQSWDGGCWWKPSDDPIRNLEKAGALIAAEIDRLRRAK